MIDAAVRRAFTQAVTSPDEHDLPLAAALLGHLEYHRVDPAPALARLARLGEVASAHLERVGPLASAPDQLDVLNTLLFEDEGFTGNVARYEDPRNSFLADVVERRTGIPISLAVVYLDVARRAGLRMEGINFPGHFLVRFHPAAPDPGAARDLIVDPFHQGAILSEADCRQLLRKHVGDEAAFDRRLLAPAGKHAILVRMLQNLKRLYVSMRSFPQARAAVDLLLDLEPVNSTELRDRGLLSYHLQDFHAALRDLEGYFRVMPKAPADADDEERQEHEQVWEHLKTLRRRVAELN
jgi:regulator of sirC expression with transglutaminase-like and TPR domain